MTAFLRFLGLCLLVCAQPVLALVVRAVPDSEIMINSANPSRGYFDLMLQTIVVYNDTEVPVSLDDLQVELLLGDRVMELRQIDLTRAERASAEFAQMAQHGMGVFLNLQLLDRKGLAGILDAGAIVGSTRTLSAHGVLLAPAQYFAVGFAPDRIRINALGHDEAGKPARARAELKGTRHESLSYGFPLKGNWMMQALPMLQGHHRWVPSSEFARDWFKVGAEGAHAIGDALKAENNLGYGERVRAAADGVVVEVIADQVQDRAAMVRHANESIEAAQARISGYNMQRYARDFKRAAAGNLVVIRHDQGGRTEFTSYGHLKAGSVTVAVDDKVRRGQKIGEVGDTGDSSAVHLHFQVNAGPDPFYTQSLPFEFEDMRSLFVGQDPALLVGLRETGQPTGKGARP